MSKNVARLVMLERLAKFVERHRFTSQDEYGVQDGVEQLLTELRMPFVRELSRGKNRYDFALIGNVVVEVKVRGSVSDLIRQLHRYAKDEGVCGMLVVTTKRRLAALPLEVGGKPVRVAWTGAL